MYVARRNTGIVETATVSVDHHFYFTDRLAGEMADDGALELRDLQDEVFHHMSDNPGVRCESNWALVVGSRLISNLGAFGTCRVDNCSAHKETSVRRQRWSFLQAGGLQGAIYEAAPNADNFGYFGGAGGPTMTRQVLFIQGGGDGVHDKWDDKLVNSPSNELGPGYTIRYPVMPNEADPSPYDCWAKGSRHPICNGRVVAGTEPHPWRRPIRRRSHLLAFDVATTIRSRSRKRRASRSISSAIR